jgi:hypothetical protein
MKILSAYRSSSPITSATQSVSRMCRNGVTRLTIVLLPNAGREVAQLVEEVPHYEMNLRDKARYQTASKAFRKAELSHHARRTSRWKSLSVSGWVPFPFPFDYVPAQDRRGTHPPSNQTWYDARQASITCSCNQRMVVTTISPSADGAISQWPRFAKISCLAE